MTLSSLKAPSKARPSTEKQLPETKSPSNPPMTISKRECAQLLGEGDEDEPEGRPETSG